jgi:hypothetical protein
VKKMRKKTCQRTENGNSGAAFGVPAFADRQKHRKRSGRKNVMPV